MSSEDILINLRTIIQKINCEHKKTLEKLDKDVLLMVRIPDHKEVHLLIGRDGVKYLEKPIDVESVVKISYKDLMRLMDEPSKVVRYMLQGKILIKGDLGIIEKLMDIIGSY
ncbi:MAG: SCP2 sterol-binding domain-containing protein [Aquificaceae bacterium]